MKRLKNKIKLHPKVKELGWDLTKGLLSSAFIGGFSFLFSFLFAHLYHDYKLDIVPIETLFKDGNINYSISFENGGTEEIRINSIYLLYKYEGQDSVFESKINDNTILRPHAKSVLDKSMPFAPWTKYSQTELATKSANHEYIGGFEIFVRISYWIEYDKKETIVPFAQIKYTSEDSNSKPVIVSSKGPIEVYD